MKTHQLLVSGILALALGLGAVAPAGAQDQGDPPGRVGRVAQVSGTVSFHTADENQWEPATPNYPVTSGNSFWTEPRSHAAIDIGPSRFYLDSSTQLDIGNLADQSFVATLPQGAAYLRVPDTSGNDQYEIDTPRGAVRISQPGAYEIVAGDTNHPTTVTVFQGAAQVVGQDVNVALGPGQAAYISGEGPFSVNTGAAQQDDFVRFVQDQERPYASAPQAPRYVSPQQTGYQDLDRYGQWQQTPDYGSVWVPQVAAGWAPYREGHWAYVAPWGWTWIDDAPWGFTPFHYGRWVQYRNRWAWTPGVIVARPIYAPALVSFFGNFGGVGVGVSIGGGNVGWVPLGPEEVYVPWYRHSRRYGRDVNIVNVHNETKIINVINNTTIINNYNNYSNRHGATMVSANAMRNSRPISREFQQVPQGEMQQRWNKARPLNANANTMVKPTYATAGVTPEIGRKIGALPPPNGVSPERRAAPGPKVMGNQGQGNNRQPQLRTFNKAGDNGANANNPGNGLNQGNKAGMLQNGNNPPMLKNNNGRDAGQQNQPQLQNPQKKAGVAPGAAGPAIAPKNGTFQFDQNGQNGRNGNPLPLLKNNNGGALQNQPQTLQKNTNNGSGAPGPAIAPKNGTFQFGQGGQNGKQLPALRNGNGTPQNQPQIPNSNNGAGNKFNGNTSQQQRNFQQQQQNFQQQKSQQQPQQQQQQQLQQQQKFQQQQQLQQQPKFQQQQQLQQQPKLQQQQQLQQQPKFQQQQQLQQQQKFQQQQQLQQQQKFQQQQQLQQQQKFQQQQQQQRAFQQQQKPQQPACNKAAGQKCD
ncbi:MAG: hypothetical protein QOK29_2151 [Rhodospirillaceae bacterium]|nr:hypothetical protein [Rhodospirillaceae bacterium]